MSTRTAQASPGQASFLKRWVPLLVLAGVMVLALSMGWHRYLSFETIGLNYDALKAYISSNLALALLIYIGTKLLVPDRDDEPEVAASAHLLTAIRTIIVADAVMSLDNVIAIAGAADGRIGLVALGIAISVPIIVWGSKLVLALMDRYPIVILIGGALLGWIAGGLWIEDPALHRLAAALRSPS